MQLTPQDIDRINRALYENGHATPSNVRIEHEKILIYNSNEDRRDSMIGAWSFLTAILEVDFDGDPATTEIGPRGLAPDVEVVISLKPGKLFKD